MLVLWLRPGFTAAQCFCGGKYCAISSKMTIAAISQARVHIDSKILF